MKVVLIQEVPGLGNVGDVKEVAGGYGRNYLISRGYAQFATPNVLKKVDKLREVEEKHQQSLNMEMADFAKKLEGLEIIIKAKVGGQERLYGSVTGADIADYIKQMTGQDVDKRKIMLSEAIHKVGEYGVSVKLSRDLSPKLKVIVVDEKPASKVEDKAGGKEQTESKPEETAAD
ncbi:MAG: 50S ribosomal protein L9 [Dehalococcoidia bacterium]|jgi:large subunit ribosomal protein L9